MSAESVFTQPIYNGDLEVRTVELEVVFKDGSDGAPPKVQPLVHLLGGGNRMK